VAEEDILAKEKQLGILGDGCTHEAQYVKVLQQYEKRNENLVF
jgi:hypothetical protein